MPVFSIIGIGYFIGKLTSLDITAPSYLTLYMFTPCLFFNSMLSATIKSEEILEILTYAALLFIVFMIIIFAINALILRYNTRLRNALCLASAFPNSGNYGLPIIFFAFSQAGFERAIIFAIFQSFLVNSVGVFLASRSKNSFFKALINIAQLPGFYALLVAMLLRSLNISIPQPILKPIQLLGQAAIPTLLIVLGIQLGRIRRESLNIKFVGLATILRLVLYPIVGYLLVLILFQHDSLTAKVLITISATPAGITPSLLAIKFDMEPELVIGTVFVTTLLSIITVSLVLLLII